MLLAVDIGNTNIVLGLWDGRNWLQRWRLSTVRDRTADEYGIELHALLHNELGATKIGRIIIASVVPQLTRTFSQMSERYLGCEPLVVTATTDLGIEIDVDFPDQVGADRLVNATAAFHAYGGPCIVVDMGTATKLEVVTRQGKFIGGVITPGLQIISDALFQRAAKLSQVEMVAPPSAIGRNTIHALQSGLILGYTSLIEGMIPRLKREIQAADPTADSVSVIGTGGLINLIAPHTRLIDKVDPWLTLSGLKLIAERQSN